MTRVPGHSILGAAIVILVLGAAEHHPRAQSVAPIDRRIMYILPQWGGFLSSSDGEFLAQVQQLRSRLGPDGPRVRLGFTTYITIGMAPVDPADTAAVRAALAPTIEQIDRAIARAQSAGIPVCLSFLTAIRSNTDAAELTAQSADRRTMQWHSDNSIAAGWRTLSRYARREEALQEAFIREVGRVLANRMQQFPNTLVAASGDGEVELSYDRSLPGGASAVPNPLLADYSPFAIAEFRDWLRADGLYAAGQPFAGEAWQFSARYAGDVAPDVDSNGDGHTLKGDFSVAFTTWNLQHFDWSLSDPDARAIPSSTYAAPGWVAFPSEINGGFDAPRGITPGNPWWDVWNQFRQVMVWRHNLQFARWMTTSADPLNGATVPGERWFSDQIPADYLFGSSPAAPDFRLTTSASPWWTADISPYGSLGITSFNVNQGNGNFARTLRNVAPQIAQRRVRWGVFEWNPSLPFTTDINVYRDELALVERYRPSVLAPFLWSDPQFRIEDTGFEVALREFVARNRVTPLGVDKRTVHLAMTTAGVKTPDELVRVSGLPGDTPQWTIASVSSFLTARAGGDGRTLLVGIKPGAYATGTMVGGVTLSSADPGYGPVTITVRVRVVAATLTTPPTGRIDTPGDNAIVSGEVPFTGWAVDDVGIGTIGIFRDPVAGEAGRTIFLGNATVVPGARPDVQAAYSTQPQADRAGWGFMVLTNMLPNQGNGVFRLLVVARDLEGRETLLGTRRLDVRNRAATKPFGTIDTPRQGETVSGTIINFGWALTPQPAIVPFDGSTISIYIDGVFVGHPEYNHRRDDIATLFPGYANTNGAVGFFPIDTTLLSNGLHSIVWGVTDSQGRASGVGSRYFTVANP